MPKLRPAPKTEKKEELNEQDDSLLLGEGQLDGANGDEGEDVLGEQQEDATTVLQAQIDALKKSEEIQRTRADQAMRDREEALKQARARETEMARFQKEAQESQFDAVSSALAAAKAEAEKAQQDIENAISLGDTKGQAEAYRRLAKAETAIAKMEDGKTELEARLKEEPAKVSPQIESTIDRSGLPETAKAWLTLHPDYLSDPRKNSKIQALHWDVIDEGHAPFSNEYFISLEEHLGMRQKSAPDDDKDSDNGQQSQQRTSIVSAPVSREAPGGAPRSASQIRLTPGQREAAKMAGISEKDYAEQLRRLNEMRANGTYGDRQ